MGVQKDQLKLQKDSKMKKENYQKILEYFSKKNGITQIEKDVVIRKVMEYYYNSIIKHDVDGTISEVSDAEKDTLENSIVSEGNLDIYYDSAKTFISSWEQGNETLIKKHINTGSFWKSVGANVFSNFLYSIILIIIFWIAKSQISDWLISLTNE